MMFRTGLIGTTFLLAAEAAVAAPDRIDIVTIYEQFVAADAAAKHCDAIETADRSNWSKNFIVVSLRAAMAVKARNPAVSDDDLKSKWKFGSDSITSKVESEASGNGCSSPRIEQLLKLYGVQARLHFN